MMSGTFKGFTENEIQKMKKTSLDNDVRMKKKKPLNQSTSNPNSTTLEQCEPIRDEAKLFKPKIEPIITANAEDIRNDNFQEINIHDNEANNNVEDASSDRDAENLTMIVDSILRFERPVNMQEFQLQQKLIEEQNRKRREMLSKALEDREKQTAEEAIRLEKIKKELQTLDAQLSGDVSILRKQIDKCSLAYAESEKQYHKIEMEFLAAKMHLQKEKERKEMLTEHLCTLIAHNESRKAKKLESLMDQLAYNTVETLQAPTVCDGVCEQTGKMLEIENGEVVLRDEDDL
ncbi:golgin, RAB6 interacting [Arctopsyche grandis]|uniref:golgin, RAB6 interacting n=1 Tax=Arctopsyche grandis TaxID=121162 RepID=UPI00406DA12C